MNDELMSDANGAVPADTRGQTSGPHSGKLSSECAEVPLTGASDSFGLTPRLVSPTFIRDPLLGVDLGGVRIVRLIGEGGMGRVYEAVQGRPERTVAVKVMRHGNRSKDATRRFEREAEFLARLQHPGIAQVFVVGTYSSDLGQVPFHVMEFIPDALPITEYAVRKSLTLPEKLQLFRQVCEAIAHGHDRGIVHRDIKPGNILINGEGRPKIIDFGVARSFAASALPESLQTGAGHVVGTLQYMSPEQCNAKPDAADSRADVYALGVVLYQLATGALPYDLVGMGLKDASRIICDQEPAGLRSGDPLLPDGAREVIAKCLHKEPRARYATARDLAVDIQRYLEGQAIERAGSWPGAWSRGWLLMLMLGLAAAAVIAIAGLAAVSYRADFAPLRVSAPADVTPVFPPPVTLKSDTMPIVGRWINTNGEDQWVKDFHPDHVIFNRGPDGTVHRGKWFENPDGTISVRLNGGWRMECRFDSQLLRIRQKNSWGKDVGEAVFRKEE